MRFTFWSASKRHILFLPVIKKRKGEKRKDCTLELSGRTLNFEQDIVLLITYQPQLRCILI